MLEARRPVPSQRAPDCKVVMHERRWASKPGTMRQRLPAGATGIVLSDVSRGSRVRRYQQLGSGLLGVYDRESRVWPDHFENSRFSTRATIHRGCGLDCACGRQYLTMADPDNPLRSKIMAINNDETLSDAEKAMKRQELMCGKWLTPSSPSAPSPGAWPDRVAPLLVHESLLLCAASSSQAVTLYRRCSRWQQW